ncbi:MAG: hypothetical protein HZB65_04315 [Candidatus Aenigmarchaeota archaeon]|nr:hypothetical protein [Candidatus Aenigmarchaeota archaeon]
MTELNILEKFVQENSILPSQCAYHTRRDALNKAGKKAGKMRILVLKADNIARVEYICPECSHHGYHESQWQRPFSFKCNKCNSTIKVPKMKEQFKREMKAVNKAGK